MTAKPPALRVGLIWAMAENGVIGKDGGLPWHLPDDFRRFARITRGCPVVMGRRTWESVGHPLPDRCNLVVTSRPLAAGGGGDVVAVPSLAAALEAAAGRGAERAWVIGGAGLYREAEPIADLLDCTLVHARPAGDTRFPDIDWTRWELVEEQHHPADERHRWAFTHRVFARAAAAQTG